MEKSELSGNAKIFPLLGLTSIKHAERDESEQKMKARLVGRGDIGRTKSGGTADESEDLWAPVAQLSTVRIVQALGAMLGLCVESLDITSAYLQAELRTQNEYFVVIPNQVLSYFSPAERKLHSEFREPVYRLRKALYGLQRSAFDWISTLIDLLKSKGWISTQTDPALMYRDVDGVREFISIYVDDLMIAAPKHRMKTCWSEIRDRFVAGESAPASEYIGVRFARGGDDDAVNVVDMRDYAKKMVDDYKRDPIGK